MKINIIDLLKEKNMLNEILLMFLYVYISPDFL